MFSIPPRHSGHDARPNPFPELWPEAYRRLAEGSAELLRAGTPHPDEERPDPDALPDPTGEAGSTPLPFLLRKYADRALLLVTGRCEFHCRFCFRRGAPPRGDLTDAELDAACAWLGEHPEIDEVILSGGDPLTLADARLKELLARLSTLPSVASLRIHTRAPVVAPQRVGAALLQALAEAPKPVAMAIHPVHPAEFRPALFAALRKLTRAGVPLSAQAVLLRGVNDSPETLLRLFRTLADADIAPRYLHHTDRAPGNRRFRVSLRRGLELYGQLRRLAAKEGARGAVPPYVIDLPNGAGKVPMASLALVAEQRAGAMRRARYRWPGDATRGAFEWWDIRENTGEGS